MYKPEAFRVYNPERRIEMNRQILVSLLAAAVLVGAPMIASADDDRDRKGDWKIDKKELRDHKRGLNRPEPQGTGKQRYLSDRGDERYRDRHKDKSSKNAGKDKHRYPGERYPFTGIDRFKYDNDHKAYRPDRHHKHGNSYWYYDSWDRYDHPGKKHDGYRARVISVVPVNKVIRSGRHCRGDYGSGDWLELSLGDVMISIGNDSNDCYYLDREIRNHYRVTYIYKGRLHTVRMHHHPGKYIRVNHGGNPVRGRH
jgi:hypothetical protein